MAVPVLTLKLGGGEGGAGCVRRGFVVIALLGALRLALLGGRLFGKPRLRPELCPL